MKNGDGFISPADRGFRFGDGVFETIPYFDKHLYQWDFHLNRLKEGLSALHISLPEQPWRQEIDDLIAKNALMSGFVRIAVSRGVGSKGYRPLADPSPTIIIETIPRDETPQSISLWLSTWRKPPLNCLPANHKTANGLNSTLALLEAETHDCCEALLLSHDNMLCEAASGNLFWVKDDKLFTPELSTGCLSGATRHAIIRLHDAPIESVSAPIETLEYADAVFLTNCSWGILPVTALKPQGWEWPPHHPLIETLQSKYQADIDASV